MQILEADPKQYLTFTSCLREALDHSSVCYWTKNEETHAVDKDHAARCAVFLRLAADAIGYELVEKAPDAPPLDVGEAFKDLTFSR